MNSPYIKGLNEQRQLADRYDGDRAQENDEEIQNGDEQRRAEAAEANFREEQQRAEAAMRRAEAAEANLRDEQRRAEAATRRAEAAEANLREKCLVVDELKVISYPYQC